MLKYSSDKLYCELQSLTSYSKFYVAYSGGIDSHVLLHSLATLRTQYPDIAVTAIHVNHGISPYADLWERFCQKFCATLGVDCLISRANVSQTIMEQQGKIKPSMEAIARELRYQIFAELLPQDAAILTAHQANDQAETVLLQLFRGAGPRGIAAIAPMKKFAKGELLRPLLHFSRDDLVQYALLHKLSWVEDESNADISIERNYVRHRIIPTIVGNRSSLGILKTLGRVAQNCAEASYLLDILAKQDYFLVQSGKQGVLSAEKLKVLDALRQRNVLRFAINELRLPLPNSVKLQQIQKTVLFCSEDANPLVVWHGAEVRRFRDNVYIMSNLPAHNPRIVLQWQGQQYLQLPSKLGILCFECHEKNTAADEFDITVRFRCGGETIQLAHRENRRHSLKNLFQEWEVPVWMRDRIPLVYLNEQLIAIVGYVVCENNYLKNVRCE